MRRCQTAVCSLNYITISPKIIKPSTILINAGLGITTSLYNRLLHRDTIPPGPVLLGDACEVRLAIIKVLVGEGVRPARVGVALDPVALDVALGAGAAVVDDGGDADALVAAVVHVEALVALGVAAARPLPLPRRGAVPGRRRAAEEGLEQRAERGHARGGDAKAGLDGGPHGDVGSRVKEIVGVVQKVEVRKSYNGRARGTIRTLVSRLHEF